MRDWGFWTRISAVVGLLFGWMILGQMIFPSRKIPGSVAPELDGRWITGTFVIVIGGFIWALFGLRGSGSSYEPT